VLGGGNALRLKRLPAGVRLGSNANAILGGFRMWHPHMGRALKTTRRRLQA
jgi:hypothetical protein